MNKKNITIYDIAVEAGVSPSTVSRVLTGSAGVNVSKSRKIQEIIQKYDFKPNALARSLFKRETNTIGIILPDISNPFFASFFLEVEKCAMAAGYSMILCNSMNPSGETEYDTESMYLKMLTEKQVDGIILLGGSINSVKPGAATVEEMISTVARVPVVMVNGQIAGVECFKVRSNEREGVFSIIEYLVSLGHKDIGFFGGVPDITSTSVKIKALREALQNLELNFNEKWIIFSSYSIESGSKAMRQMLSTDNKPTAVVAVNDFVAIGAIKQACSEGLKIPDDISITGFDDSYLCSVVTPSLTSVSHNIPELARKAVGMLCSAKAGRSVAKENIIKTSLVIRESCKSIKE